MKLLRSSLRSLNKFRLYTYVNILGLAMSLACIIIIARYVHQETTVNHFAKDIDRTFISSIEFKSSQPIFTEIEHVGNTFNYKEIMEDPSIERVSHFKDIEDSRIVMKENTYIVNSIVADTNFIKILPYPVILGTAEFKKPNDVVLKKNLADKIFGKDNPIGSVITFTQGEPLQIIGVIGEPSIKTSFNFDLLVNTELKDYWYRSGQELVLLKNKAAAEHINQKHSEFTHVRTYNDQGRFQLYPFNNFYFNQTHILYKYENPVFIRSDSRSLKVLSIVAIFLLIVGVFNFINIYQVVAMKRSRELGVHKIYGADSSHIFIYIYLESLIMTIVALFFSWWFIELFEALLNNRLGFKIIDNIRFNIFISGAIILFLPLITSIYPSLKSIDTRGLSTGSRKIFLFIQYIITFGLLVISMFFVKQLRFMLDADLGYNTENVMMCTLMSMPVLDHSSSELMAEYAYKLSNNQQLVKQKMDKSTLFTEWAHGGPLYKSEANYQISLAGKEEYKQMAVDFIDNPNMNMFDFQLVEGRLWDSTDVFYQYKCIINESAMKMFNIKDFSTDYLQFQTRLWTSSRTELDMNINPTYEIVGVIKDFNTGHLSKSTLPMVFVFNDRPNPYSYLMGRFIPGKEKEAATYLEGLHKEINNNAEFKYSLLKDNIAKLYEKDKQVSNVYSIFALMAIFVSCLGLFALSLFDIQQRHREIGLRKINGATTKDIMYLLLKKYLLLLLSAFLISIPLSYFAIYKYLEGFAYKATISWWLFVISGFIVVGISVITISWQVRKAMKINPVEAFKLIK